MRTVTVSHNWYSVPRCSGTAVLTVFGVPSDVSCRDWGRVCQACSGLVGMEAELGHSLTDLHWALSFNVLHTWQEGVWGDHTLPLIQSIVPLLGLDVLAVFETM